MRQYYRTWLDVNDILQLGCRNIVGMPEIASQLPRLYVKPKDGGPVPKEWLRKTTLQVLPKKFWWTCHDGATAYSMLIDRFPAYDDYDVRQTPKLIYSREKKHMYVNVDSGFLEWVFETMCPNIFGAA